MKNSGTKVLSWIAWRYLVAKRKGNGLSFMTMISIVGVGVGVAALIVVLSVMGGFERDLKSKMLRGSPHLEFTAQNALAGFPLADYPLSLFNDVFADALQIEPFTQSDVVLENGKHLSSAVLFGIQPEGGGLWGFKDSFIEGQMDSIGSDHAPLITLDDENTQWPGIVLGDKLASQLGADLGDEITILSPSAMLSTSSSLSGGTLSRHYVVSGIFHTGLFNYDAKWAVVRITEGRRFLLDYSPELQSEQYVSGVGINSPDPMTIESFQRRASQNQKLKDLKSVNWKESNSSMILALKLEKFAMGSIMMLIVLVASFSISGTMMMAVFHKKREVCILRSLGLSAKQIVRLFLIQAHTIASVGIALGVVLGLTICLGLYGLKHSPLPEALGILKVFPVRFLPLEYGLICLFAWLLSVIGACYPAWTASRQDPSRGLRY